jgi:ribosomal protein S18 acetylase RimI-like enzyme
MVIRELDNGVVLRRIESEAEAVPWRASFIGTYQTVFSGHPYFERFSPSEAEGIYQKLTQTPGNITLLATRGPSSVVGFGIGIPLKYKKSVAAELTGLVPIDHAFYLAELGVLPKYRGQHLGRTLVRERLKLVDQERYTAILLRVSVSHHASAEMYKAMGFEDMGVYTEVRGMRTDGRVASDRRLFMARVLSQVQLD